jgi:SAM-dependent methyltransferase
MTASRFAGDGPGMQTPDGCSVDLYRRMPYLGELEDVIGHFARGMAVLELGCGTGRLCSRLSAAGCLVTGVDESAEMLARLAPGIEPVHSSIEALSLARRFDAVLLASHLINHPDPHTRQAFVRCARRHLKQGGIFLLQRHNSEWLRCVQPGPAGQVQGILVNLEAMSHEKELVHMTLRYELSEQVWRQSFSAIALAEADIEELLVDAAFAQICWHGPQKLWASAIAVD